MATAVARIGREKRLATLAKNLYVIEGDEATELQRRAERALLRQNPGLAAADGFAAGRIILVPPVPGLRTTPRVTASGRDLSGVLLEASVRLQSGAGRIEEAFRAAEERRETALRRLQDRQFLAAAKRALEESPKLIDEARVRMERDRESAKARRAEVGETIRSALAEIEKISKLAESMPER